MSTQRASHGIQGISDSLDLPRVLLYQAKKVSTQENMDFTNLTATGLGNE